MYLPIGIHVKCRQLWSFKHDHRLSFSDAMATRQAGRSSLILGKFFWSYVFVQLPVGGNETVPHCCYLHKGSTWCSERLCVSQCPQTSLIPSNQAGRVRCVQRAWRQSTRCLGESICGLLKQMAQYPLHLAILQNEHHPLF